MVNVSLAKMFASSCLHLMVAMVWVCKRKEIVFFIFSYALFRVLYFLLSLIVIYLKPPYPPPPEPKKKKKKKPECGKSSNFETSFI